jgi:hypothetical protein
MILVLYRNNGYNYHLHVILRANRDHAAPILITSAWLVVDEVVLDPVRWRRIRSHIWDVDSQSTHPHDMYHVFEYGLYRDALRIAEGCRQAIRESGRRGRRPNFSNTIPYATLPTSLTVLAWKTIALMDRYTNINGYVLPHDDSLAYLLHRTSLTSKWKLANT